MRLKITAINFTNKENWLFTLESQEGVVYKIMNEGFYKRNNRITPITKKELDSLDKGYWVNAKVELVEDIQVVCFLNK